MCITTIFIKYNIVIIKKEEHFLQPQIPLRLLCYNFVLVKIFEQIIKFHKKNLYQISEN
jgi:hypothetical protein